ncbi:hypothetical protein As57867_000798, partial [Aphanomyces stellatus]
MSWDLSHLSTKYPWLQVNASTLQDFRDPFDWSKKTIASSASSLPGGRIEEDGAANAPSRKLKRMDTGRQVLVRTMRDHLTDAVVLGESPPRHMPPHAAISRVVPPPSTEANPRTVSLRRQPSSPVHALLPQKPTSIKRKAVPPKTIQDIYAMTTKKPPSTHPSPPPPTAMAADAKRLHDELQRAKDAESAMMRDVAAQMDAQRATLPLQFLFEHNMSAYSMGRGVDTILKVFGQLQSKYLFHGLSRWKTFTAALRKDERRHETDQRVRARAITLLNRVAGDCLMGNTQRALHRWRHVIKHTIAAERDAAAVIIQKHVKRRRWDLCPHEWTHGSAQCRATAEVARRRAAKAASDARDAVLVQEFVAFETNGRKHLWTIRLHAANIRVRRADEARRRQESAWKIQCAFRSHVARVHVAELRHRKHAAEAAALAARL